MNDIAPYPFSQPQNAIPQGVTFPMVLCTTAERLQEILNAIKIAEIYTETSIESKVDILEALAFLDNPQNAPCYPPSDCDEDTNLDDTFGFLDEIVDNIRSGGISKAIGYVIENYGEVIFTTALKVVGVTVLGYLTGGIVSIFIDDVLTEVVNIASGDELEFILTLPKADPSNVIKLIYDVAA